MLGAACGSFLNVCIYRFPLGQSVLQPGSHCPHCKTPIRWIDNIPLVSFVLLRARCRQCREKISWRYFLVELASAGMWPLLWHRFGPSPFFAAGIILCSILLAITVTDFETGIIPDAFTFPGMAAGLILSAAFPVLQGRTIWLDGLVQSGLGLAMGGALLLAIGWFGTVIFRKESMGGGDIKLLAMIGSFLGIKMTAFVFLFSPLLSMPLALYMKFFRKAETIPFGPFLALSAFLFFVFGDWVARFWRLF